MRYSPTSLASNDMFLGWYPSSAPEKIPYLALVKYMGVRLPAVIEIVGDVHTDAAGCHVKHKLPYAGNTVFMAGRAFTVLPFHPWGKEIL